MWIRHNLLGSGGSRSYHITKPNKKLFKYYRIRNRIRIPWSKALDPEKKSETRNTTVPLTVPTVKYLNVNEDLPRKMSQSGRGDMNNWTALTLLEPVWDSVGTPGRTVGRCPIHSWTASTASGSAERHNNCSSASSFTRRYGGGVEKQRDSMP
jgi:hypothetical protein